MVRVRWCAVVVAASLTVGCSSGSGEELDLDGDDAAAPPPIEVPEETDDGGEPDAEEEPPPEETAPPDEPDEVLYPPLPDLEPDPDSDIPVEEQEHFLDLHAQVYETTQALFAEPDGDEDQLATVAADPALTEATATLERFRAEGIRPPDLRMPKSCGFEVVASTGGPGVVQECRRYGPMSGTYETSTGELVEAVAVTSRSSRNDLRPCLNRMVGLRPSLLELRASCPKGAAMRSSVSDYRPGVPFKALTPILALASPTAAIAQVPDGPCTGWATSCAGSEERDAGVVSRVRVPGTVDELVAFAAANPAPVCEYETTPDGFDPRVDIADTEGIPAAAIYYIRDCGDGAQWRWYVIGSGQTNDEALVALIGEAFGQISPPAPQLVTSPPLGSEVLTGFPVYLAVDDATYATQVGQVSAGQITVTAEVRPLRSRFVPGDTGAARECDGAGSRWSSGDRPGPDDCTHTFTVVPASGGSFALSSQVTYEASYTVTGPILAGDYDLGEFDGPETIVDIPVIERRAVRVER